MGEVIEDFSTLKRCFIIVLICFARECLKNGLDSVAPSPSMPLSSNVDLALLSLIIDCVGFYGEREKKPTADSQHSAPFVDCFMDFFLINASSFITVLEQTHLSPFTEKSKERVGKANN